MKLTLEPSEEFAGANGVLFRVWKGRDEAGVEVHALIAAVQPRTDDAGVARRFVRELEALPPPRDVVMMMYSFGDDDEGDRETAH